MKKKLGTGQSNNLMMIGFILFFAGIFFATVLRERLFFQIAGIVLLISSSAVFGASMRINGRTKN